MKLAAAAVILLMAGCLASDPYSKLASDLAGPLGTAHRRVAVLPFRGIDPTLNAEGEAMSERLLTELYGRGGIELVERSRLQQVLSEFSLAATGAVEGKSAKELGRLLGAEALVVGTVVRASTGLEVAARLVDVETGRVLSAAAARLPEGRNFGTRPEPPPQRGRSLYGRELGPGPGLPMPLGAHGAVASSGRIYVIGGVPPALRGTGRGEAAVLSASVSADGRVGGWRGEEPLPEGRYQVGAAVSDGFLYAVGGYQGTPRSEVFVSDVGFGGRLGPWRVAGSLPGGCVYPGAAVADGRLYVAGCSDAGGPRGILHSATVGSNGALGAWTSTKLPEAAGSPGLVSNPGGLLLLGGARASGGYSDAVFRIERSGPAGDLAVSRVGTLPEGVASFAVAAVGSRVWLAGGYANRPRGGRPESAAVRWAEFGQDGRLGVWTSARDLPLPVAMVPGASAAGRFFVVGGEGEKGNTAGVQAYEP